MSHTSKPEGNSSSAQSTQPSPDARVQVVLTRDIGAYPRRLTRVQHAENLRDAKADQANLPDQTGEHIALKCACPPPGVELYVRDRNRPGVQICPVCAVTMFVPPAVTGGAA